MKRKQSDSAGWFYLACAGRVPGVPAWLPFANKEGALHRRVDALLNRQPGANAAKIPGKKADACLPLSAEGPLPAKPPAYAFSFPAAGLFVQQAVRSVVGGDLLRVAPYVASTKTAAIVFSGFLSNLGELLERLQLSDGGALLDVGLGSSGDQGTLAAEVVLALFTRSTSNPLLLLSELQGQYAFAAFDSARKQVFAARDPSGAEPLFYAFSDAGVSFTSRPATIPADGEAEADWAPLLPGHYVAGRAPREVQQFALTPEQLTRLSIREALEDDLSISSGSGPGSPHDAEAPWDLPSAASLRRLSERSSGSLRSSTELDARVRTLLAAGA